MCLSCSGSCSSVPCIHFAIASSLAITAGVYVRCGSGSSTTLPAFSPSAFQLEVSSRLLRLHGCAFVLCFLRVLCAGSGACIP